MKTTHYILNKTDCVAVVYEHETLGRVVVFRRPFVDLEFPINIHPMEMGKESEDHDILEFILKVLPK